MEFFNLSKDEKKEILNHLREVYSDWKNQNQVINKPFFAIHTDFENLFLKDISGGALKLYIYLGFRSKYKTGETWESIDRIALYFEKDKRTVANWFAELEELYLVERHQTGFKRAANTFLKPYGYFFKEIPTFPFPTIDDVDKEITKNIQERNQPYLGLMLTNYSYSEHTLVILYKNNKKNLYYGSYFTNFPDDEKEFKSLRKKFMDHRIKMDRYDVSVSLNNISNIDSYIYKIMMEYLNEESY